MRLNGIFIEDLHPKWSKPPKLWMNRIAATTGSNPNISRKFTPSTLTNKIHKSWLKQWVLIICQAGYMFMQWLELSVKRQVPRKERCIAVQPAVLLLVVSHIIYHAWHITHHVSDIISHTTAEPIGFPGTHMKVNDILNVNVSVCNGLSNVFVQFSKQVTLTACHVLHGHFQTCLFHTTEIWLHLWFVNSLEATAL